MRRRGTEWMKQPEKTWPSTSLVKDPPEESLIEMKSQQITVTTNMAIANAVNLEEIMAAKNFSSNQILFRVTAYFTPFTTRMKSRQQEAPHKRQCLQTKEIMKEKEICIKCLQDIFEKRYLNNSVGSLGIVYFGIIMDCHQKEYCKWGKGNSCKSQVHVLASSRTTSREERDPKIHKVQKNRGQTICNVNTSTAPTVQNGGYRTIY